jgi:hypothetical protein
MHPLHAEKPPLSSQPCSQNIDLILWHPVTRDPAVWLAALAAHGLGERSEPAVWLSKFTVRLAMWRGQYLALLTDDAWQRALVEVEALLRETHGVYRSSAVEYDTRAFTVGVVRRVRRGRRPLSVLSAGGMDRTTPVWWRLTA